MNGDERFLAGLADGLAAGKTTRVGTCRCKPHYRRPCADPECWVRLKQGGQTALDKQVDQARKRLTKQLEERRRSR